MKKILVALAIAIVMVVLAALAATHYNKYEVEQNRLAETASIAEVKRQSIEEAAAIAEKAALQTRIQSLQAECVKGANAYGKLTAWQKRGVPQPVCD
jgi:hypothetical protein